VPRIGIISIIPVEKKEPVGNSFNRNKAHNPKIMANPQNPKTKPLITRNINLFLKGIDPI